MTWSALPASARRRSPGVSVSPIKIITLLWSITLRVIVGPRPV